MNIAVLSDTHDHIENLEKVLKEIKGKVKAIIFSGDMTAPFTAAKLGSLGLPVYACLGNTDSAKIKVIK